MGFVMEIKFVSLEQLVRYNSKRNETQKDKEDTKLIKGLLHRLIQKAVQF